MKRILALFAIHFAAASPVFATTISIIGEKFHIDGAPTYKGRTWNGHKIEGLLLNSRMVQGVFDDANPETIYKWAYPDTGKWDPDRNTREFIAAMPDWKRHGMLAFTINFQGGSPEGYSSSQQWDNNAYTDDGEIKPGYAARMKQILNAADRLGMVAILGYFYFGQSPRLRGDEIAIKATENATRFLFEGGWKNVLVEINNETNPTYQPRILRPDRVHGLIEKVKAMRAADGGHLLVGASYAGGVIPTTNVVGVSDFILIHGNGVKDPARIREMARKVRALPNYRPMPILFNEDDHFDFEKPTNNFIAAVSERASWGYFDYRMNDEGFNDGYQSVPVNWGLSSDRKRGFFKLCAEISGAAQK